MENAVTQPRGAPPSSARQTLTAAGIWLPCGPEQFFDPTWDRMITKLSGQPLPEALTRLRQTLKSEAAKAKTDESRASIAERWVKLEVSVVWRAFIVCAAKGYEHVYFIPHHAHHSRYDKEDTNPYTMILTRSDIPQEDWDKAEPKLGEELNSGGSVSIPFDVRKSVHHVALIVNAHGFYQCVALHDLQEHHMNAAVGEEHMVRMALQCHIERLMGGDYYSHISKNESDGLDSSLVARQRDEQRQLGLDPLLPAFLADYAARLWGILSFYQVNVILEAMFNHTFAPRVFFHADAPEENIRAEVREKRREFSVGNFAALVVAPRALASLSRQAELESKQTGSEGEQTDHGKEQIKKAGAMLRSLAKHETESELRSEYPHLPQIAQAFTAIAMNDLAKEYIIVKFLQATTTRTLLWIKSLIERSRRALLDEMIQFVHSRQQVVQIEVPDEDTDRITGVTESQIRNYVLLFAAKFPLLENLHRQLQSAIDSIEDPGALKAIGHLKTTWETLLTDIENDIASLDHAVEESRQNQLLIETERIRTEQETLAEVSRLRERAIRDIPPAITVALAIIAVLVSLLAAFNTHNSSAVTGIASSLGSYLKILAPNLIAIAFQLALTLILFGILFLIGTILAPIIAREVRGGDINHYYEFDLHIDVPLPLAGAAVPDGGKTIELRVGDLFEGKLQNVEGGKGWIRFSHDEIYHEQPSKDEQAQDRAGVASHQARSGSGASSAAKATDQSHKRTITCRLKRLIRNSYRVERFDMNEALHKLYFEVDMWMPRELQVRNPYTWRRRIKVRLYLVYEILFERPSNIAGYRLNDLRVVAIERPVLQIEQIEWIKKVVLLRFVNPLLPEDAQLVEQHKAGGEQLRDSLFIFHEGYLPPSNRGRRRANGGI
jgi:hypothetical protein